MIYHVVTSSNALGMMERSFQGLDAKFYTYDYVTPTVTGKALEASILQNARAGDLLVSFDNFHVFSAAFLSALPCPAINFHPSPLPAYGGINPVSWGIYNREAAWGATWHTIDTGIDTGGIIRQTLFDMPPTIHQIDLLSFCLTCGIKDLKKILAADITPTIQPSTTASYYSGTQQPSVTVSTLADANFIERAQPFTPKAKWRWNIDLSGTRSTLISTTQSFKGKLALSKSVALSDGSVIYYAD